jgi:DNA repair protein RecO (recombination protein O)
MAVSTAARQDNQPVYVLHTYPFKETSLVVELFTRDFGRIAAVAKGARRPRSAMRGMLQSFQPLLGAWSGKLELRNLHSLEWGEGLLLLQGEALMCGFYLNELLLRLLPREDAHEALFDYYRQALRTLASGQQLATTLRRFELRMLQEMGYAVPLEFDDLEAPIDAGASYRYMAERGASNTSQTGHGNGLQSCQITGKTLLDMLHDDYADPQTQQQSKQLMRTLLAHYLGDKPLYTRQLLIDLQGL